MDLDYVLINYCSPTLAGLKQASLLCLPHLDDSCTYDGVIEKYNHKYNAKGLYFRILYACPKRTLLYVYRPARVWTYVQQRDISSFLQQFGYQDCQDISALLARLAARFAEGGCFPHESGIFLGYPLEDVCGFIANKGNHAKLCGEWKVYGDTHAAARTFHRYTCCRQDYLDRFAVGTTLNSLIVA